jgi:hypothetical protein
MHLSKKIIGTFPRCRFPKRVLKNTGTNHDVLVRIFFPIAFNPVPKGRGEMAFKPAPQGVRGDNFYQYASDKRREV